MHAALCVGIGDRGRPAGLADASLAGKSKTDRQKKGTGVFFKKTPVPFSEKTCRTWLPERLSPSEQTYSLPSSLNFAKSTSAFRGWPSFL